MEQAEAWWLRLTLHMPCISFFCLLPVFITSLNFGQGTKPVSGARVMPGYMSLTATGVLLGQQSAPPAPRVPAGCPDLSRAPSFLQFSTYSGWGWEERVTIR